MALDRRYPRPIEVVPNRSATAITKRLDDVRTTDPAERRLGLNPAFIRGPQTKKRS